MTTTPHPEDMPACGDCGMPCKPGEYHPYAACLMFKACHNSETVRANLEAVAEQRTRAMREALQAYVNLDEMRGNLKDKLYVQAIAALSGQSAEVTFEKAPSPSAPGEAGRS